MHFYPEKINYLVHEYEYFNIYYVSISLFNYTPRHRYILIYESFKNSAYGNFSYFRSIEETRNSICIETVFLKIQ